MPSAPNRRSTFFSKSSGKKATKVKEPEETIEAKKETVKNEQVFGLSLEDAFELAPKVVDISFDIEHQIHLKLPNVIAMFVKYLELNDCFSKEGIFRISGSNKRITKLQNFVNKNPKFVMNEEILAKAKSLNEDALSSKSVSHGKNDKTDEFLEILESLTVHDVAALLKRYLNGLPDSIVPFEIFKDIKSELDKSKYKDLVIFAQTANEATNFDIKKHETENHNKNIDSDASDSDVEDKESIQGDAANNTETADRDISGSVSIIEETLTESTTSKATETEDTQRPLNPKFSFAATSTHSEKEAAEQSIGNSISFNSPFTSPEITPETPNVQIDLLKARTPLKPPNFRKHSMMSVFSIDSALEASPNVVSGIVKEEIEDLLQFVVDLLYEKLNLVNMSVFIYILEFLYRLSENTKFTKMNSFNLSKIFQTSFFLVNQLNNSSPIDIIGQTGANGNGTGITNGNGNRLSVSINSLHNYSPSVAGASALGNPSNKLSPTFTRNSVVSATSWLTDKSSSSLNVPNSNNNFLQVGNNNFSLESFNSINVDYNINQLLLKVLIDNFKLLMKQLLLKDDRGVIFRTLSHLQEPHTIHSLHSTTSTIEAKSGLDADSNTEQRNLKSPESGKFAGDVSVEEKVQNPEDTNTGKENPNATNDTIIPKDSSDKSQSGTIKKSKFSAIFAFLTKKRTKKTTKSGNKDKSIENVEQHSVKSKAGTGFEPTKVNQVPEQDFEEVDKEADLVTSQNAETTTESETDLGETQVDTIAEIESKATALTAPITSTTSTTSNSHEIPNPTSKKSLSSISEIVEEKPEKEQKLKKRQSLSLFIFKHNNDTKETLTLKSPKSPSSTTSAKTAVLGSTDSPKKRFSFFANNQ